MTDETTILLEVLAIQLYESEMRVRQSNRCSWRMAADTDKEIWRKSARKWFENKRDEEIPQVILQEGKGP